MAQKTTIRSIRFSDELAELIDRQQGSSFTQKFENLISRCVWELPTRERELSATINDLFPKVLALENAVSKAVGKWKT